MAAKADGDPFFAVNLKTVDRCVENFVFLGFRSEQLRNLLGSVVLLSYNQFHWLLLF